MRVCPTQAWPLFISPENTSIGSVESRSASSRMIAADFPPSSSEHGLSFSAAILAISLPTADDPVNVNLSSSGLAVSARPVSGPPGTIDSTPSGRPASANDLGHREHATAGSRRPASARRCSPPAAPGPSLLAARKNGTFHAVTAPTTPIGSRTTMVWP